MIDGLTPDTPTRGVPSPLVEAVTKHKGDWKVGDSSGSSGRTSNITHEMFVPLNDDFCRCGVNHGDVVRSHELVHAKISPTEAKPGKVEYAGTTVPVSTANLEVAEEYRVNASLVKMLGEDELEDYGCPIVVPQIISSHMDQGRYDQVIRYAVAGGPGPIGDLTRGALFGYRDQLNKMELDPKRPDVAKQIKERRVVAEALADAIPSYLATAQRIMGTNTEELKSEFARAQEQLRYHEKHLGCCSTKKQLREAQADYKVALARLEKGKLPSWSQTEQLAAFLEVNLRDLSQQIKDLLAGPPAPTPDLDEVFEAVLGDSIEEGPKDLKPELEVVAKLGGKIPKFERKGGKVQWGKNVKYTTAQMPLALPAWKVQRITRAVDEGTIPRFMHRWVTDKRIFGRTKKVPGGTLLVDDSGSMGLSSEDLDRIIETLPMGTVAVYAGSDGSDGGEVRVVAKNGKRALKKHISIKEFGGNGIDGPALEWLGEQDYPRIWISDGGVTAPSHGFSVEVAQDAKRICVKNKITLAPDVETAVTMLKTGKLAR